MKEEFVLYYSKVCTTTKFCFTAKSYETPSCYVQDGDETNIVSTAVIPVWVLSQA